MELASDAVAVCCVAFCTLSPSLCRRCGTWHCNRNHNRAIESQAAPDHFTLPERFAVSASAGTNGDTSVCRKFLDCAPVGHGQQQGGAQSQEGADASSSDREYMQMAAAAAPAAAAAAAAATTVPAPPPASSHNGNRRVPGYVARMEAAKAKAAAAAAAGEVRAATPTAASAGALTATSAAAQGASDASTSAAAAPAGASPGTAPGPGRRRYLDVSYAAASESFSTVAGEALKAVSGAGRYLTFGSADKGAQGGSSGPANNGKVPGYVARMEAAKAKSGSVPARARVSWPGVPAGSEVDADYMVEYVSASVLQMGTLVMCLVGLDCVTAPLAALSPSLPGTAVFGLLLFCSLKSDVFAAFGALTRRPPRAQRGVVVQPTWAPPAEALPVIKTAVAVLHALAGVLVWEAMGQVALCTPLAAFMVHLGCSSMWDSLYNREGRLGAGLSSMMLVLGSAFGVVSLYSSAAPLAGTIFAPTAAVTAATAVLVGAVWRMNGSEPLFPLKSA